MTKLITTFFYSGLLKPAPGTWGSLAGLLAGWAIHAFGGPTYLAGATTAYFIIAMLAIQRETAGMDDPDKSEIVADEVVGQWIAMLPISAGATAMGVGLWDLWPGMLGAFLLFRLFDIWKPGPIGWADRRKDAAGIMLDDVIAGTFAAISVSALAYLYHAVLV